MAQAARPLPPVRVAPRTPHLQAVPIRARPPGPSAAVIRRRRIVALAGLVALVALPLAWLSVTGSPATDTGRITAMLEQGIADPAKLCDHLSTGMLQAV